ncbi:MULTISPECIES: catabolic alanine racemase DadX [unclassified Tatumella]|uniref:catabolic alanine racemase DadX n=1 Tax=unclassified Tatumella TaxID=2649542 RepID=UPI001BB0098A|nr:MULTISPECIES: catabolic alanine racemase DadX [unclassified Tatumella]MBS0855356.1 catabolic alanine racemase DadX [Tatumella sp. JGM16]MBS0911590.1 catabolic alanine racemase DadX [Tatumella sp. JGM91]
MSRPIIATVSQQALQHNLAIVKQAAPAAKVWSVVKSNAYGHGISRCYTALSESDGFALLNYEEAIQLRESGWQKPLLLLEGFFKAADLALLDGYRLTTSVHSEWQITALANARLSAPLDIYVKVNSGMNRLGFRPDEVPEVWNRLAALDNVGEMTLMTHFARAELSDGVDQPVALMAQAAAGLGSVPARCFANSAATLWHPETHHQWIRPGIILYGVSPSGNWQDIAGTGLKPVMGLHSEIIGIQQLTPGEGVGYGYRYHAASEHKIGIVACGYADGYPRHAPSGTPVAVDGVMTRTLGAVSMDMMMIDLAPCPAAHIGSVVELWGQQVPADDVAQSCGTVGYELLCAVAPRVPFRLL